jgi:short-subunit dehydrogenase
MTISAKDYFKDQVIIITGASSGIGRAAALKFAGLHAKVVLAARNEDKLNSLRDEILLAGGRALVIPSDVSVYEDAQRIVRETILQWEKVDILIACAGKYVQDTTHEIDILSFGESMAVNFYGTLNVIKSVLPEMKRRGSGHIVIVNSLDAKKGIIGDGPYVAAKAALDGFGDVLRQEMKPYKIAVTSVYPGRVDTPMIEHIKATGISAKILPGKVVKAMIKGIKKKKAIVVVPKIFFPIGALNNLVPRFLDRAYRILRLEGEKIVR